MDRKNLTSPRQLERCAAREKTARLRDDLPQQKEAQLPELLAEIFSLRFIVTVVAAGVIVNWISDPLKKLTWRLVGNSSGYLTRVHDRRHAEREERIARAIGDHDLQMHLRLDGVDGWQRAMGMLVLSFVLLGVALKTPWSGSTSDQVLGGWLLICAFVFSILGGNAQVRGQAAREIALEAWKREQQELEDPDRPPR